ncbi:MAG: DUF1269 domain-containing protein [Chloroflexi bacterium]|nr:DUF1269 domain-containing protein [Chloroflexota bacterium]
MSHGTQGRTGKLMIGAKVDCTDGSYGTLDAIIVDPLTRSVTHYVVRDQNDHTTDRLVPAGHCIASTPELLQLDCTVEAVASMPPFTESEFVTPSPVDLTWSGIHYLPYVVPYEAPGSGGYRSLAVENVPSTALSLRRGMRIEASDGYLGDLGSLVVDVATGRITHFVLQTRKGLQQHEITLPLTAVDYVLGDTARLKLDQKDVGTLPTIPVRRPILDFWRLEHVELVALVFDGTTQASEALHFLQDVQRDDRNVLKIHEAAVLVREENGNVSIRETADVSRGKGGVVGGVIGGAVAIAGAPVGVLLGALAGAVAGGTIGPRLDLGFSDAFLARLHDRLDVGRSALILLIEHEWSEPVANALGALQGIIPQQQLIDTVVQDLLTARE